MWEPKSANWRFTAEAEFFQVICSIDGDCLSKRSSKKKLSLLCGAGLSNIASGLDTNKPINTENLMTSAAAGSSGYPGHDAGMPLSASGGELKTEHSFRMEIDFTSELHPQKECKAYDARMQNTLSLGTGPGELSSSVEKESKNDAEVVPSVICPLENLELSDENDLKALLGENACCATTKIVAVESANKVGDNSAR